MELSEKMMKYVNAAWPVLQHTVRVWAIEAARLEAKKDRLDKRCQLLQGTRNQLEAGIAALKQELELKADYIKRLEKEIENGHKIRQL